jgi:hypothetical protein
VGEVRFEDRDGFTNQNRHRMLVEQVQDGRHYTVWPPELATRAPIWPYPARAAERAGGEGPRATKPAKREAAPAARVAAR